MTYEGHIENGVIVPDEPIEIENGVKVVFEFKRKSASEDERCNEEADADPSLTQLLSRFAGKAVGLPEDAAENHDHYLYGVPKK